MYHKLMVDQDYVQLLLHNEIIQDTIRYSRKYSMFNTMFDIIIDNFDIHTRYWYAMFDMSGS